MQTDSNGRGWVRMGVLEHKNYCRQAGYIHDHTDQDLGTMIGEISRT